MNPELLLLSTRIALVVLIASAVAFLLGWLMRGGRPALVLERQEAQPQQPVSVPAIVSERSTALHLQEIESLNASLANTEQQCIAALEQRDEAERLAHERGREVRRLTDELETLRKQLASLPPAQALVQPALPITGNQASESPESISSATIGSTAVQKTGGIAAGPDFSFARHSLQRLEQEAADKEPKIQALEQAHAREQADLETMRQEKPNDKPALKAAAKRVRDAQLALDQAREAKDRAWRQHRAVKRSLAVAEKHAHADDLTSIKGIKAVLNQQLNAFGIYNYEQIMAWDEEDIQAFSELLAFKNRIRKDQWQQQAHALAAAAHGDHKSPEKNSGAVTEDS